MTSPMLTVVVLAVLWLIVVVPMVVRRNDQRAGERSVARFGSAMRALGSRRPAPDPDDAPAVVPRPAASRATVTVPGGVSTRRPVPAARESLMYEPDRHDMSEARQAMLARRRRSLSTLGAGTVLFVAAAMFLGGMVWTALAAVFAIGLAGYLWFLRSQALRDRERRETRRSRAEMRPSRGYDVTAEPPAPSRPEAVVRIDDDNVELSHLDTVDLTGLYADTEDDAPIRRAG